MTGGRRWSVLAATVAALLVLTLAIGCSKQAPPAPAAQESEAMKAIKAGGKLIVGTEATFPPFEFVDTNNQVVGFDVDVAREIAKDLGVELQMSEMEFKSLIPALQTAKIHMIAAAMTITDERKQSIDFSDPYYDAGQSVVAKASDTAFTDPNALDGKKVAVQTGTTGDLMVTEKHKGAKVVRYDKFTDAFMDLQNGRVDAVVLDTPAAQRYVATISGLKVVGNPVSVEQYGMGLPKNSPDLLAAVNKSIARMKSDGTFDKLVEKWLK